MYTSHACFARLSGNLYAQSVLSNKISASELTRKFIKGALLVGSSPLRLSKFDCTFIRVDRVRGWWWEGEGKRGGRRRRKLIMSCVVWPLVTTPPFYPALFSPSPLFFVVMRDSFFWGGGGER